RLGARPQAGDAQIHADELPCLGVQLDKGRRRSPTAEGLNADPARAGEEVEKTRALDLWGEDVEERRFDALHDRADVGRLRRLELPSLRPPRHDSHQFSPRRRAVLLWVWPRVEADWELLERARCSARSVASTSSASSENVSSLPQRISASSCSGPSRSGESFHSPRTSAVAFGSPSSATMILANAL